VKTADRILKLADEMDIKISEHDLVINLLRNGISDELKSYISDHEFKEYHILPYDGQVEELLLHNRSLLDLPEGNKLYDAVIKICEKI